MVKKRPWILLGAAAVGLSAVVRSRNSSGSSSAAGGYVVTQADYDKWRGLLYDDHAENGIIPEPGTRIPAELLGEGEIPGSHLTWAELASPYDGAVPVIWRPYAAALARALTVIDRKLGGIRITNCYRGPKHSEAWGGAALRRKRGGLGGYHPVCMAADFRVSGKDSSELYGELVSMINAGAIPDGGVGRYGDGASGWKPSVHYDVRGLFVPPGRGKHSAPARWTSGAPDT